MIRKTSTQQGRRERIAANHYIRYPEVRVLSERGEMIGVMATKEALVKAREAEKDLVLITENAKPPVAKIIDLAKYKYQLQQKKAEGRKAARKQDLKEVRFTPFMGDHDFATRLKKVIQFLEKGDKVRITIQFRGGRQLTKKDFGFRAVDEITEATKDIAELEIKPKMVGKKLMAQFSPVKKKKVQTNAADDGTN
jgi:translation initiation factor IF-3